MEIGDKQDKSIVDLQNRLVKDLFKYGLILVTLLALLAYVIFNKTTLMKKLVVLKLSILNNYETSVDGNYTIFKNNDSIIMFRCEPKNSNKTDKNASMYHISNSDTGMVQSQQNILANIDNVMNPVKNKRLGLDIYEASSDGYIFKFIGKRMGKQQIVYESNFPIKDKDILKYIIQYSPIDTSTMTFNDTPLTIEEDTYNWYEEWKKKQRIKLGESPDNVHNTSILWTSKHINSLSPLQLSINNDETVKTTEELYNTYTNILLIDNGIIIGNCANNKKSIENMEKTINELLLISFLQKTSLL